MTKTAIATINGLVALFFGVVIAALILAEADVSKWDLSVRIGLALWSILWFSATIIANTKKYPDEAI